MKATDLDKKEGLIRSRPNIIDFTRRKRLLGAYYKKKYFSMNISEQSLTKYFNWNNNYTKPRKPNCFRGLSHLPESFIIEQVFIIF